MAKDQQEKKKKKNRKPDHGDHQKKKRPRVESTRIGHANQKKLDTGDDCQLFQEISFLEATKRDLCMCQNKVKDKRQPPPITPHFP